MIPLPLSLITLFLITSVPPQRVTSPFSISPPRFPLPSSLSVIRLVLPFVVTSLLLPSPFSQEDLKLSPPPFSSPSPMYIPDHPFHLSFIFFLLFWTFSLLVPVCCPFSLKLVHRALKSPLIYISVYLPRFY